MMKKWLMIWYEIYLCDWKLRRIESLFARMSRFTLYFNGWAAQAISSLLVL